MADLETSILIKILDAFTAPLRKLTDGLGQVEEAGDKAKKRLAIAADLNQAAESAGRFGNMLIGPVKGAVEEFANFDKALSKLSAMGGGDRGSAVFESMKKQAEDLGAATQFSAEEVVQLQTNFLKANFSTDETLSVVKQTMAAASAEGIGLAETSTIVAGALRGMNMHVSEASRVTDVLAVASVKSDADMRGLSDALVYVGPQAAKAGMSFELTTAMLGKLSDAQIKGSMAGTSLRAVFSRLVDPAGDAKKAFKEMGIEGHKLKEIQKDVAKGNLDKALASIGAASSKLPNEKQLELLSRIFGQEASTGAQVLISATMDKTDLGLGALVESLKNARGQTQKMADVMQDNLAGSLERAGGALSGLNTAIGAAFAPTVKAAAGQVEELAGAIQGWVKENPRATESTMTFVATLGAISLSARGVLLAASAYQTLAAGVMAARVAGDLSKASHLGLAAAALAVGYSIGTYINKIYELDDKLSTLFGRPRGFTETQEQGLSDGRNPVQGLAGGWEVDSRTGAVLTEGKGPAPKSVQKRLAAMKGRGAATTAEANAILVADRDARLSSFRAGGGMLAGTSDQASLTPGSMTPGDAAAQATREQTQLLLETLRKAQKAAEEQAAQTKLLNLRLGSTGGGVPLVYG